MQELLETDLKECADDKIVMDAWIKMGKLYDDFMAQENWEDLMKQNYLDNKAAVDGFIEQMVAAWDIKKYYESGKLAGLVDTYLYAM